MRITLVVLITSIALLWVYENTLIWTIGHAMALPRPSHWGGLFPTHLSAALTWMQLIHTTAILVVSIPFAFLIAHFYGRRGVWLALGLTAALLVSTEVPAFIRYFDIESPRVRIVTAFDFLKILVILPVLVLLMHRLTSNNRWRGP